MAPDPLRERLQRALEPDYRVERDLASGGMGIVYLARELTLGRDVAVKVLRPERATAEAAEAFLREARIIAGLRHPNIVTIYRAGEGAGLHYYIMEMVEGPTLESRLESGPLSEAEAVRLGRDLLSGLDAVHRAGIVHRDVKPGNVFVLPDRAVLGDFGIARAQRRSTTSDEASHAEGTPGYMAPEQLERGHVTPRTDIYATAVVLYEALTARRFPARGAEPSWKGVRWAVARVLRRALRAHPEERWADARAFRDALRRTRVLRALRGAALLTLGALAVGAVITFVALSGLGSRGPGAAGAVAVVLPRFEYSGPASRRAIADSIVERTRFELRGHLDFRVTAARSLLPTSAPALTIRGRVSVMDSSVRVQLDGLSPAGAPVRLADWRTLSDSLTYRVLLAVWDASSPLAASLPMRTLPRTGLGLARFLEAERLIAAAQWGTAYRAYLLAESADSTCRLCSWRLHEVERWLSLEHDPARVRRMLAHLDSFPPWYASLIHAGQLPLRARLDTLHAVTAHWGAFFLGWFQLGDELLHRGALAGRRRAEAVPALETAARRRPDFAPAWEHLAWALIAEGDSAGARRALDSLDRTQVAPDPYTASLRSLLDLAFAWRFLPDAAALAHTRRALHDPVAGASADVGAGPRMLAAFDAPRGASAFGRILEESPARDLQRSGLIAQALSAVALGNSGGAADITQRLVAISPEDEIALFAAELQATLALLDTPGDARLQEPRARLRGWAASRSAPDPVRRRAAWMSRLLGDRAGRDGAGPLALLGAADSMARGGLPAAALALTDAIDIDRTARELDPFFRTVARLRRAEWRAQLGDAEGAQRELIWHEHSDVVGLPIGLPQAAEIDWAFATLARWRQARLQDASGDRAGACSAYAAVARNWADGDSRSRARADSARSRLQALGCARRGAG